MAVPPQNSDHLMVDKPCKQALGGQHKGICTDHFSVQSSCSMLFLFLTIFSPFFVDFISPYQSAAIMPSYASIFIISLAVLAQAAPAPTQADKRATACTFTAASQASASKTGCATIVLDNIAVPAGQTLDLTKLTSGTQVSAIHYQP